MRAPSARRLLVQAAAAAGLIGLAAAPLAAVPAQDDPAIAQPIEESPPLIAADDNIDAALIDIVNATGLGDVWLDTTDLQRELAFLTVDGAAVEAARDDASVAFRRQNLDRISPTPARNAAIAA